MSVLSSMHGWYHKAQQCLRLCRETRKQVCRLCHLVGPGEISAGSVLEIRRNGTRCRNSCDAGAA